MKNTTEGIQPYQKTMIDHLYSGGFKRSEMSIIMSGRRAGKSMLNQMYGKLYNNNLCKEILLPMTPAPKYKFSRAKWYVADFNWNDYDDVYAWCTQQFGPEPTMANQDAWSRWIHKYGDKIHFRDQKDYHWFILRWGV